MWIFGLKGLKRTRSPKLKMLGPLCNQIVNLETDAKTLYCSLLKLKYSRSIYLQQKKLDWWLVRFPRICTSKVDFINRLRGPSLRLRQQGFESNLLHKSFNKFFSHHVLIVEKYGAALREMRLAIQAWIAPSYPYITYFIA